MTSRTNSTQSGPKPTWSVSCPTSDSHYSKRLCRSRPTSPRPTPTSSRGSGRSRRRFRVSRSPEMQTLSRYASSWIMPRYVFFKYLIVCFTSYSVFRIAVLPHRETRDQNSWGCPLLFPKRDLFVHRGQKCYTPTAFGKLWTTPGVRCMKHASS